LGTNIKFKIGTRPVTKQDGDASSKREQQRNLIDREIELPAGAIRVAPQEETVEGIIAFPNSMWNGRKVEGLVLTFRAGRVVDIKATLGLEAAKAELDAAGEAGHSFREFAMGFNPLLAIPPDRPWIPYYGYGAGVVRLSLGDNSELGGNVTGDYVRWNFFTDATVLVGQEEWVKEGKSLKDK
jgi:Thermophilic metalloprotease (M29)